jgi:hypothetical protein
VRFHKFIAVLFIKFQRLSLNIDSRLELPLFQINGADDMVDPRPSVGIARLCGKPVRCIAIEKGSSKITQVEKAITFIQVSKREPVQVTILPGIFNAGIGIYDC